MTLIIKLLQVFSDIGPSCFIGEMAHSEYWPLSPILISSYLNGSLSPRYMPVLPTSYVMIFLSL